MAINGLHRDKRDTTDPIDRKFRRACDIVQEQLDDRWPARDTTGQRSREWPPLEDVSRAGRLTEYRKRPNAR
jgi:hypothetical protein